MIVPRPSPHFFVFSPLPFATERTHTNKQVQEKAEKDSGRRPPLREVARSAAGGKLSDEEFAHVMQDGMEARQRLVVCNLALVVSLSSKYKRSHFNCKCLQVCLTRHNAASPRGESGLGAGVLLFAANSYRRSRENRGKASARAAALGTVKVPKVSHVYFVCAAVLALEGASGFSRGVAHMLQGGRYIFAGSALSFAEKFTRPPHPLSWCADPDSGGDHRADPGGGEVRPRKRFPVHHLRHLVDRGAATGVGADGACFVVVAAVRCFFVVVAGGGVAAVAAFIGGKGGAGWFVFVFWPLMLLLSSRVLPLLPSWWCCLCCCRVVVCSLLLVLLPPFDLLPPRELSGNFRAL